MNYDFNMSPRYKEDGRKWYPFMEHQLVWMIAKVNSEYEKSKVGVTIHYVPF